MILHTLNASPTSAAYSDCIALLAPGDAILLMGDGVYAAIADTDYLAQLRAATKQVYVLEADAAAAGILERMGEVQSVDIDGFVALTEQFARQLAWY